MKLNITVTAAPSKVAAGFKQMPQAVLDTLVQVVTKWTLMVQRHVIADKLTGQVLNVRTGALRRSIQAQPPSAGSYPVVGYVYSSGDVKYAAIHEFGGKTPPHDIYPSKAKALAFAMGGEMVFAKVVHHPGSVMPERSFLRSALGDYAEQIAADIKASVVKAAKGSLAA